MDGQLKPDANLLNLVPQFSNFANLPLNKVPLSKGQARLTFRQPIAVQVPGLSLTMGASGQGTLAVLTSDQHLVDTSDPFHAIPIQRDETYLALGADVSAAPGAAFTFSSFGLSFSSEHHLTIRCYRRFASSGGVFPSFAQAFAQTAGSFVLPQTAADLATIDANTVIVIAGAGQLQIAGTFGISTPTQQILSSSTVLGGQTVSVNASGSVSAEVEVTLAGGFQVRLRRLDNTNLEVGAYKMKSVEAGLALNAHAGVAASAGKFDLAQKFIEALSQQPAVDVQEFQQALPAEDPVAQDLQIQRFETSLEKAVSTTVEASLTGSLSSLQSDEAVLQFEVNENALATDAGGAIAAALKGDFRALTQGGVVLPPGIRQTANATTRTNLAKLTLNVNLLGLVNFFSVAKLARLSTVERAADGSITLVTDIADENRLQAAIQNGNLHGDRLRELLSEDFLLQAAFSVSPLQVLPPDFSAKHSFFAIHNQTGRPEMKNVLDVCRIVGVVTDQQEESRLRAGADFGRTTFLLRAAYGNAAIETLFAADGKTRSVADYEQQGRLALAALLTGDDGQEFRKAVASTSAAGNELWKRLKEVGNVAAFHQIFGVPATDPRVAAAGSDYLCITSWADAMNRAAQAVSSIRTLLQGNVKIDDRKLQQARTQLRDRLAAIVKASQGHFGEPLGMMMVYFASGQGADIRAIVTGAKIDRLDVTRPASTRVKPPLTAGATGGNRA